MSRNGSPSLTDGVNMCKCTQRYLSIDYMILFQETLPVIVIIAVIIAMSKLPDKLLYDYTGETITKFITADYISVSR